jgi:hypothetical protein
MKTKKELKAPEYVPAWRPKPKKIKPRVPALNQQKRLKLHREKKSCKKSG